MPRLRLLATVAKAVSIEANRAISVSDIQNALKLGGGETKTTASNAEVLAALGPARPPRQPRKRASRARRQTTTTLSRRTGVVNPEVKAKLQAVINRDQELARTFGFDEPDLEKAGAIGFRYRDPMDDLLEDIDLAYTNGRGETRIRPRNYILVSQEQLAEHRRSKRTQDQTWRFRWRSNELYRMVERLLSNYWVDAPICRACEREIHGGFGIEVKDLLIGKKKLENLLPPTHHDTCFGILHVFRDLELALKGRDQDDPETVALRARAYEDSIVAARSWLIKEKDVEVSYEELQKAFVLLFRKLAWSDK